MPSSAGDLMRAGSFLREKELSLGVFFRTAARMQKMMAAMAAMIRKAALQPTKSPIVLPKGSPMLCG